MSFKRIGIEEAKQLLLNSATAAPVKSVQIVDIRDDEAFGQGRIDNAVHLHNANLQEFVDNADLDAPLLVYCYHGHMSQSAAAYFAEQGFAEAYSLDGGYEAWAIEK